MKTKALKRLVIAIWILAILAGAGTAYAAFANILNVDFTITGKSGPEGNFSNLFCEVAKGPGTVDTCLLNGDGTATIAASGVNDASVIAVELQYDPTNFDQLFSATVSDPLPAGISKVKWLGGTYAKPGDTFAVGSNKNTRVRIRTADITPDQVISDLNITYEFTEIP